MNGLKGERRVKPLPKIFQIIFWTITIPFMVIAFMAFVGIIVELLKMLYVPRWIAIAMVGAWAGFCVWLFTRRR